MQKITCACNSIEVSALLPATCSMESCTAALPLGSSVYLVKLTAIVLGGWHSTCIGHASHNGLMNWEANAGGFATNSQVSQVIIINVQCTSWLKASHSRSLLSLARTDTLQRYNQPKQTSLYQRERLPPACHPAIPSTNSLGVDLFMPVCISVGPS